MNKRKTSEPVNKRKNARRRRFSAIAEPRRTRLGIWGRVVRRRNIRTVLAENIRKEIATRDLGTNKLADFAGVSRSQLYDVLAARKGASVDWVAKVADVLDLAPWELLRENGTAKIARAPSRARKGRRSKKTTSRRRSR